VLGWVYNIFTLDPTYQSFLHTFLQFIFLQMDVLCVHLEREKDIARRMGITSVPAVVLIIDAHPYHYRETVISAAKVVGKSKYFNWLTG